VKSCVHKEMDLSTSTGSLVTKHKTTTYMVTGMETFFGKMVCMRTRVRNGTIVECGAKMTLNPVSYVIVVIKSLTSSWPFFQYAL